MSYDPIDAGWAAQVAAVAAHDEASISRWEADYHAGRPDRQTTYRTPHLPTCEFGCCDPWNQDSACPVHAPKERS